MSGRVTQLDTEPLAPPLPSTDLTLRSPPNWTAVGFFGCLALLHYSIAVPSFWRGHTEGYL
ncbi:MAG: hypothetical protein ACREIT_02050, partial [Tepidisphaeraceae bacterium]